MNDHITSPNKLTRRAEPKLADWIFLNFSEKSQSFSERELSVKHSVSFPFAPRFLVER